MKHNLLSFTAVVAGFFMLPAVAHSQQSTKSVGDNNSMLLLQLAKLRMTLTSIVRFPWLTLTHKVN